MIHICYIPKFIFPLLNNLKQYHGNDGWDSLEQTMNENNISEETITIAYHSFIEFGAIERKDCYSIFDAIESWCRDFGYIIDSAENGENSLIDLNHDRFKDKLVAAIKGGNW